MRKSIFLIIISTFLMISAVSCKEKNVDGYRYETAPVSDNSTSVVYTAETLAEKLKEKLAASEILEKVEKDKIDFIYSDLPDNVEAAVYSTPEATATEIAVFDVSKLEAAEAVENMIKERIENQIAVFKSYNPDEVKKLENAIVTKAGNFVIMVVSKETDAVKDIIKNIK